VTPADAEVFGHKPHEPPGFNCGLLLSIIENATEKCKSCALAVIITYSNVSQGNSTRLLSKDETG
jgi:hypothetical protein